MEPITCNILVNVHERIRMYLIRHHWNGHIKQKWYDSYTDTLHPSVYLHQEKMV